MTGNHHGPQRPVAAIMSNLHGDPRLTVSDNRIFFFLEIPASFFRRGSGHERLGLRPHYRDEARHVTARDEVLHLHTPVLGHR